MEIPEKPVKTEADLIEPYEFTFTWFPNYIFDRLYKYLPPDHLVLYTTFIRHQVGITKDDAKKYTELGKRVMSQKKFEEEHSKVTADKPERFTKEYMLKNFDLPFINIEEVLEKLVALQVLCREPLPGNEGVDFYFAPNMDETDYDFFEANSKYDPNYMPENYREKMKGLLQ